MAQKHESTGSEIRDKTKKCEERFNACLAHLDVEKEEWLEISSSDFNCWSSGLNASHSGRSSLDYKLRQRPDIKVTGLLDGLDESLEEYLDSSPEECSGSDDDSVSVVDTEKSSEASLHYNVFDIKMILKHLQRIHIMIRKFGPQIRHGKADASLEFSLNHNVNELKGFTDDMTKAVLAGFENRRLKKGLPKPWSKANKQLLDRLVSANARRRNRILFATEKIQKAEAKEEDYTVEEPSKLERNPDAKELQAAPLLGKPSERSQALTAATTFPSQAIFGQASSKIAGTTISKATDIARGEIYPLPPKWPKDPKVLHIDCPYCSEPLTREHLKQAAWKSHISGDILPYICFNEDCKTPDDLYQTCDELNKHVVSEHGVPCWICRICAPDIEEEQFEIFKNAQSWKEHMHHIHSQYIPNTEFPKLARKAMRKMVPPLQCPLCDYATLEIKPNIDPEITRHIHEFSVRSLPWGTRAEGDLSKERLKDKSCSTSTDNSSKSNMENTSSTEGLPSSNHEEMWPLDHQQVHCANLAILQTIYTSHERHNGLRHLTLLSFSTYEKRIQCLDTASCEFLLPILRQLRCNMEQVLAFERRRNDWSDDQTDESLLSLGLSNAFNECLNRMNAVLDISSDFSHSGRPMIETQLDNRIPQWQDLVGHDFFPGDPDYVSQNGNEATIQVGDE